MKVLKSGNRKLYPAEVFCTGIVQRPTHSVDILEPKKNSCGARLEIEFTDLDPHSCFICPECGTRTLYTVE